MREDRRLLVLGAGGGVGAQVVKQALERGYRLTVLVRPTRLFELPSSVRMVRGALEDSAALDDALDGVEAVLSSIGMQRRNPANP